MEDFPETVWAIVMGSKAKEPPPALRVLIVEDEMLVAMELESLLDERGCVVVGPAAGIDQALALLEDQQPDIALLDINLGGRLVTPVAAALSERGVPFALLTADPRLAVGERELAKAPILEKPVSYRSLVAAIGQLAQRSGNRKPGAEGSQPAFVGDRSLVVRSLALLMDNIADELWFCDAFGNLVLRIAPACATSVWPSSKMSASRLRRGSRSSRFSRARINRERPRTRRFCAR